MTRREKVRFEDFEKLGQDRKHFSESEILEILGDDARLTQTLEENRAEFILDLYVNAQTSEKIKDLVFGRRPKKS